MRLLVIHHPYASVNLTEIRQRVPADVNVRVLFRREVAETAPDLLRVSQMVFPTSVCEGDDSEVPLDGVDGVVTFADPEVEFADSLRRRLWGPEPLVAGAWSKAVQRRVFTEAGLTRLRHGVAHSPDQLSRVMRHVGYPVVVKPLRGAGGHGVFRIESAVRDDPGSKQQCLEWPIHVEAAIPALPAHPRHQWMSSMFSVEMSTDADGVHTPIAVFGKVPVETHAGGGGVDSLRVCGDVWPSGLSPEEESVLVHATANALTSLGITRRVTHTELFLTGDGVEVVEVNGRMGGFLARVLRATTGADLVAVTIRTALGIGIAAADTASGTDQGAETFGCERRRTAAGFFPSVPLRAQLVRSSVSRRQLRELPDVVLVEAHAKHGSPWSAADHRMANLVVAADNHQRLGAVLSSTKDAIRSLYQPDFAGERTSHE